MRTCLTDRPPFLSVFVWQIPQILASWKDFCNFINHLPLNRRSYFSNLHQPDFRWFITQLLCPHTLRLNSWIFPNHSRLSLQFHIWVLAGIWSVCERAEQWKNLRSSLNAPPSSVHLHLHAKRAAVRCTEASNAVKCVERCWCFGGDQIYCQRRLSHNTIKQGWVTVGDAVWPLAFTSRHIPHTMRMKKWCLVSCTPVL